ncbi:MAG: hypothetical protein H6742_11820 [Alphaproteobacteria bacterium]|nr:hypothetical protein [Alphaproteobacteria bacterium]
MQRRWWGLCALGLAVVGSGLVWSQGRCLSAWWQWGLHTPTCPAGTPRLQLRLDTGDLQRGEEVDAVVTVRAALLPEDWAWPDDVDDVGVPVLPYDVDTLSLSLEPQDGARLDLACAWQDLGDARHACTFTVPADLPDGRYALVARAVSRLPEPAELSAPVAFFRPSTTHLLTDRPLYEPGDVVRLRSLSLDRFTGVPLPAREARLELRDADNRRVHLETLIGSDWGVAAATVPLPADAPVGTWTVRLQTGDETAEASFDVRRYELPTVTVDAHAARTWFAPGQHLVLNGSVRAWSGVPLTGADVTVTVPDPGGAAWPPPTAWSEGLPATTDADGAWEIDLGPVPDDLSSAATLLARVDAVAPSGERVSTALPLSLSPDPVVADGLTELGGGLVPAEPNRVWLRLTTPDGRPLPHRDLTVSNPWDELGASVAATTDADGVASVLIDPGTPVSLVVPERPERQPTHRRPVDPVVVHEVKTLFGGGTGPQAPVAALQPVAARASARCGWRVETDDMAHLLVHAVGGRVRTVTPDGSPVERCLAEELASASLPSGLYEVALDLAPPETRATLTLRTKADSLQAHERTPGIEAALEQGRHEALVCLQARANRDPVGPVEVPVAVHWTLPEGGRVLQTSLLPSDGRRWAEEDCIGRAFARAAREHPVWPAGEEEEVAPRTLQGLVALQATMLRPSADEATPDGPTVRTGFELEIEVDGVGHTTWRADPGAVPRLRLRPDRSIVEPGETFTVAALRGPTHEGALPDEITLHSGDAPPVTCPRTAALAAAWKAAERPLDPACPAPDDAPGFSLRAPEGRGGFLSLDAGGARVVVLVRSPDGHRLDLTADASSYAPGHTATVQVETGRPAVVSLTGVDLALGQLAPLPTADSLTRATLPIAGGEERAFGGIDAFALASGAVQGEAAALAALHRLSLRPATPPTPRPQRVDARQELPLESELAAAFWALTEDVRRAAPSLPRPITLPAYAALWDRLAQDHPDPFGAPLTLDRLDPEHLDAADPRKVVASGALLPEDVEPWLPWIRRNPDRPAMAQVIP